MLLFYHCDQIDSFYFSQHHVINSRKMYKHIFEVRGYAQCFESHKRFF
jgi:hypothetical protein